MTGADDVARVAKGQREAVLACSTTWRSAKEIGVRGATLSAVRWLWPKDQPLGPPTCLLQRDYQDQPLRYIYRLSEFGLAVRQYLEQNP